MLACKGGRRNQSPGIWNSKATKKSVYNMQKLYTPQKPLSRKDYIFKECYILKFICHLTYTQLQGTQDQRQTSRKVVTSPGMSSWHREAGLRMARKRQPERPFKVGKKRKFKIRLPVLSCQRPNSEDELRFESGAWARTLKPSTGTLPQKQLKAWVLAADRARG